MKKIRLKVMVALITFVSIYNLAQAEDTGIHLITPKQEQVFTPGDKVKMEVEVPAKLKATDGYVSTSGFGEYKAKDFDGTYFKAVFVIPNNFAGPVVLTPNVVASEVLTGASVTIYVRPKKAPSALKFSNRNYFLSSSEETAQIYVFGQYWNGVERDITSSVTGTTYTSSNPQSITVGPDGLIKVIAKGRAVISVENTGVRDFVMVVVEDPRQPDPAVDISDTVNIECSESLMGENGLQFWQTVTITNKTDLPIVGPLFLKSIDLPEGVQPQGEPIRLSLEDGANLFPGQAVKVRAEYLLVSTVKILCQYKLYDHDPSSLFPQQDDE